MGFDALYPSCVLRAYFVCVCAAVWIAFQSNF
jgi:hypothetical protein